MSPNNLRDIHLRPYGNPSQSLTFNVKGYCQLPFYVLKVNIEINPDANFIIDIRP